MIRVVLTAAMGVAAWVAARHARTATVRARLRADRGATTRWLPLAVRAPIERSLRRAGLDFDADVAVQSWAIAGLGSVTLGASLGLAVAFGAVVLAVVTPPIVLVGLRGRAARRFEAALPDALRSIAADLRSGATLRTAIDRAAHSRSATASDFERIAGRLQLGASLSDAAAPWMVERSSASVRVVVGSLGCVDQVGGASAAALDGLASSLRDRLAAAAEARAQSAQARVSAVVVGVAPLGYVAFSAAIDPEAMRALVDRPLGRWCLGVALVLDALAVIWMRRIVRDPAVIA